MIHPRARVHLKVVVVACGANPSGSKFKESTQSIVIGANGGLIELETPVVRGQGLSLSNMKIGIEIACHVTSVEASHIGKAQVGISFDEPSPHFWGLEFPPDDWNPADRELPTPERH
jgi:hypothetical protein